MDKLQKNIVVRVSLIATGCLCVVLGIIGLFVPMMPGAVFLILAAWCFARSSERFHDALLANRYLGPQIKAWQSGRGFQRQLRTRILIIMWLSMVLSVTLVAKLWFALFILCCGAATTAFILKQPVYD